MYRVVDNMDGSILAICFSEKLAAKIVGCLPDPDQVMEDGETIRYGWEDCFDHPESMIGDTLCQLGRHIQMNHPNHQG